MAIGWRDLKARLDAGKGNCGGKAEGWKMKWKTAEEAVIESGEKKKKAGNKEEVYLWRRRVALDAGSNLLCRYNLHFQSVLPLAVLN